jgi:hypothetical protein
LKELERIYGIQQGKRTDLETFPQNAEKTASQEDLASQLTQEINCLVSLWQYAWKYGDVADIMAKTDPAGIATLYTLLHLHAGNLCGIADSLKAAMLAGGYEYTPEQVQERRGQIDSKVETFYQNESIVKRHLDAVFDIAHEVQAERQQGTGAGAENPVGVGGS